MKKLKWKRIWWNFQSGAKDWNRRLANEKAHLISTKKGRIMLVVGSIAFIGIIVVSIKAYAFFELRDFRTRAHLADDGGAYKEAFANYNKLAQLGDQEGILRISDMYLNGQGTAKDPAKAISFLEQAADNGDSKAGMKIGMLYFTSDSESSTCLGHDFKKAREWFLKSGDEPDALEALGTMYSKGLGVKVNEKLAQSYFDEWIRSYLLKAEAGDAHSQFIVGRYFYNGEHHEIDEKQAVIWYEKSAAQGYAPALEALGAIYAYGGAVVQADKKKASTVFNRLVSVYSEKAFRGSVESMLDIAGLYLSGMGTSPNYQKATYWLVKAIDHDSPEAMEQMADLLDSGTIRRATPEEESLIKEQERKDKKVEKTINDGGYYQHGQLKDGDASLWNLLFVSAYAADDIDQNNDSSSSDDNGGENVLFSGAVEATEESESEEQESDKKNNSKQTTAKKDTKTQTSDKKDNNTQTSEADDVSAGGAVIINFDSDSSTPDSKEKNQIKNTVDSIDSETDTDSEKSEHSVFKEKERKAAAEDKKTVEDSNTTENSKTEENSKTDNNSKKVIHLSPAKEKAAAEGKRFIRLSPDDKSVMKGIPEDRSIADQKTTEADQNQSAAEEQATSDKDNTTDADSAADAKDTENNNTAADDSGVTVATADEQKESNTADSKQEKAETSNNDANSAEDNSADDNSADDNSDENSDDKNSEAVQSLNTENSGTLQNSAISNGNSEENLPENAPSPDDNNLPVNKRAFPVYGIPEDMTAESLRQKAGEARVRAAQNGNIPLMKQLAFVALNQADNNNDEFSDGNYMDAVRWFTAAAEAGDSSAMYELGRIYEDVEDSSIRNIKLAETWLQKSADLCYEPAYMELGVLYAHPGTSQEDAVAAQTWFEKAAELGDPEAQLALAESNATGGRGKQPDMNVALKWLLVVKLGMESKNDINTAQYQNVLKLEQKYGHYLNAQQKSDALRGAHELIEKYGTSW